MYLQNNDEKLSYIEMFLYLDNLQSKLMYKEMDAESLENQFLFLETKRKELRLYKKLMNAKKYFATIVFSCITLWILDMWLLYSYGIRLSLSTLPNVFISILFILVSIILSYILLSLYFYKDFKKKKFSINSEKDKK